jgi:hypothetical protein
MAHRRNASGFRVKSRILNFNNLYHAGDIEERGGEGILHCCRMAEDDATVMSRIYRSCALIHGSPWPARSSRGVKLILPGYCRRPSGGAVEEMESLGIAQRQQRKENETGLLLQRITQEDGGTRFNIALLNSLILRFIDHKSFISFLNIEPLLGLARELPLILISGYIYLEKYIRALEAKFIDTPTMAKFFLACSLIGAKFMFDNCCFSAALLSELYFAPGEFRYIEGTILSTIRYELAISGQEIRQVILEERASLESKDVLERAFCRATEKTRPRDRI